MFKFYPNVPNPDLIERPSHFALNGLDFSFKQTLPNHFGSRARGIFEVQDKVSSKMLNAPIRFSNMDYIPERNPECAQFAVENGSQVPHQYPSEKYNQDFVAVAK